jgi:hypothetical protein
MNWEHVPAQKGEQNEQEQPIAPYAIGPEHPRVAIPSKAEQQPNQHDNPKHY